MSDDPTFASPETSLLVNRFTLWDYLVFSGMLCVSASIGIYYAFFGGKNATPDEFLMGSRNLRVAPVALSILASFMSAITLLGTATEMYVYGTQYLLIILSYCFVIPATAYLYMPIFYKLQVTSAYEYLELRFNHIIRTIGCLTFSIQMLIYMAIVLYAPALALSQVTGISVWTSVLSIGIVCTFYTSVGGIKAVVWTDVFQIFLMFASMLLVAIKGAYSIGGFGYVFDLASKNQRVEFFKAIWFNLPGLSFLLIICALSGLVMYAKYYDCDPLLTKKVSSSDQLLPLYVMDILGLFPGIPGLFVSGIFSGALSTVSSGVNSLAAVTLEDVIKRHIKNDMSDRFATNLTKGLAMSYGFIAILLVIIAQNLGNVLQAALSIFGIVGGPLLGVFTLGIFFPFANSIGAGVGIIGSLMTCFWIGFGSFYFKPAVRKPPVSVLGCLPLYLNVTGQRGNVTLPVPVDVDLANQDIMWIYKISYVWYSMIGCMLVVFIGIIVSFITGYKKPSDVNPRTVNPLYNFLCKRFLPKTLHDKFLVKSIEEYDKEQMIALGRAGSPEFKPDTSNGKVNPAFVASDDKELALVSSARGATNIQVTTPELIAVNAFGESPISERRKTAANGVTGSPKKALSEDEAATPL